MTSNFSSVIFTQEQLAALDKTKIPQHIAIIPDGNRRWAKKRLAKPEEGHREGADVLMDVLKAAKNLGIKILTLYTFSTENWLRPPLEVESLMSLLDLYLTDQRDKMIQNGIRLETIGDLSRLPDYVNKSIEITKAATSCCEGINLVLALNYGGRDEMLRAFKSMLDDCEKGILNRQHLTEETVSRYLDTYRWVDPDLLIRTSGEYRISNFLLWQTSYTEVYSTQVLWPDFTPQHLLEALLNFQTRERRLGGN